MPSESVALFPSRNNERSGDLPSDLELETFDWEENKERREKELFALLVRAGRFPDFSITGTMSGRF